MVISKIYYPMNTVGTAQSSFVHDTGAPIDGIRELLSNALSSTHLAILANVRPLQKIVTVMINAGDKGNEIWIEDDGLGFKHFTRNIGNQITNDEEKKLDDRLRKDPEYIGKFGVGMNSAISLSQTCEIEIRSVGYDEERGWTSGFIVERMLREDEYGNRLIHTTEPYPADSKYILPHIGARITIKNVLSGYTIEKLRLAISQWFYRKIYDGWKFRIVNAKTEAEFWVQPKPICCKHERVIGVLSNGWEVYADLHEHEDSESYFEFGYDVLIKKVVVHFERFDFQARGYVMCHGLLPLITRTGIRNDDQSLYTEFKEIVKQHCIERGFKRIGQKKHNKPKNIKKLSEVANDLVINFFKIHDKLIPPQLRTILSSSIMPSDTQADKGNNESKITAKNKQRSESTVEKRGRYKKHNHRRRKPKEGQNNTHKIDLGMSNKADPNMPWLWIDTVESTIVVNLSYPDSPAYRMTVGGDKYDEQMWTTIMKMAVVRLAYGPYCDTALKLAKFDDPTSD